MKNYKVFISNNTAALSAIRPTHTVEAEYGLNYVEGSISTLAHHGPRAGNPCPCLGDNLIPCPYNADAQGCEEYAGKGICLHECMDPVVIGVSHFDLDTLGGVMRVLGVKEFDPEEGEDLFWRVAAQIDVRGVHHLDDIFDRLQPSFDWSDMDRLTDQKYYWDCEVDDTQDALNAFWAWSESNQLFAPRDGSVLDCTKFFVEAIRILNIILEGDTSNGEFQALDKAGEDWAAAKRQLSEKSFNSTIGGVVLVRESDQFVNHLYTWWDHVYMAVVGLNSATGEITLSLADPIEGVDCCAIAQRLWGPEAGGHVDNAGSPRSGGFDISAAYDAAHALVAALEAVKEVQHD